MQNPAMAGTYDGMYDISAIEDLGLQTCCILTRKFELISSNIYIFYMNAQLYVGNYENSFSLSLFLEWKSLLKKIRQA